MILKNPYCLFENELVDINDPRIKSGLNEKYRCPDQFCKEPLIARKGKIKAHHFSHKNKNHCSGLESALHLKAKEIIQNLDVLNLPHCEVYPHQLFEFYKEDLKLMLEDANFKIKIEDAFNIIMSEHVYKDYILFEETTIKLEDYEIDSEVLMQGIIPDIKLKNNINGKVFYIEIGVTSLIKEKKEKIIKDRDLTVLEVDLSKYYNSEFYSLEKIAEFESDLIKIFSNGKLDKKRNFLFTRNWINIKNIEQMSHNRKDFFINKMKIKINDFYKFFNEEMIPFFDEYSIQLLKRMNDRTLEFNFNTSNNKSDYIKIEKLKDYRDLYVSIFDPYDKYTKREREKEFWEWIKRMNSTI